MSANVCPADGCERVIDRGKFACGRHWFALPESLRRRIWSAYRSGNIGETLSLYDEAARHW